MVAISALAAVAVALFAAVPAFADVSLGQPGHSKIANFDPDTGKIKITLSVTGDTDTSESKSSANLIVVLDKSGSMNEGVDKVSNPDTSKTYYVQDDDYGWYEVSYREGTFLRPAGWYIKGTILPVAENELFSSKTTRLDVAKSALYGLADQLILQQDSTVKISLETFSKYGNAPSEYYGGGQSTTFKERVNKLTAGGGTNWTDALAKANKKADEDSSTPTYIVFLSDGKPTYTMKNGELKGNGSESQPNISEFVEDAADTAKARPKNVVGFYAIYTGSDAADSMDNFASRTNASPNNQAIDGSNSTALQSAFSDIVKTINKGISYTNVKITDTKSNYVDYVLPDGKAPEFTYAKGGAPWANAPKATFENGQVSWDLRDLKLEKGVTYSVSFEVTLTQDTYDKAARGELSNTDNKVPTNSTAKLWYSTVITTTGQDPTTTDPTSIDIPSPTVTVPTSTLHISKNWVKNGWDNVNLPNEITVQVKQDNKDNKYYNYKKVTLNASNKWSYDVDVAAGPTGHTYTVEEENARADWEATLLPKDGVKLTGLTAQRGDQAITNTLKTAKLTIAKSVTGNFGDTSKAFSFTLTLTDASGNPITKVTPDKDTSGGVTLGTNGSFELQNRQKLVVELPYGASYQVVENDPKGTNDTVGYTTSVEASGGSATTDAKERTAKSLTGGITKDTTITYTNKRDVTPDVGVDLGSGAPYAAVFGGAGLAGVIWMVLKRRNSLGI